MEVGRAATRVETTTHGEWCLYKLSTSTEIPPQLGGSSGGIRKVIWDRRHPEQ